MNLHRILARAGMPLCALPVLTSLILAAAPPVAAQPNAPVRIGMLTDMSSAYSDLAGKYSVVAAQMAIADFGGKVLGREIVLVTADHQMKPANGSAILTQWFDRDNVSAVFSLAGSSVSMAAQAIAKTRPKRTVIYSIAGTPDLNGKDCLPNGVHWAPDFYAFGVSPIRYVSQKGGKSWYVIGQDTAAGPPAYAATLEGIRSGGGRVVGEVRVPINAGDVSSFVLQAQAARPNAVALGFGGTDMVNIVKAARQFGMMQAGVTLVANGGLYASDIAAMGLVQAAGIVFATPFYPEMNPDALAWSKRFQAKTGVVPAFSHVAEYEAVTHYLKAVQKAGTDDATAVVPVMKALPINSFAVSNGRIREDSEVVRPLYLARVKTPAESKSAFDYAELLAVVPPEQAYSPISRSECPLVKK
ncbi:ABC transporter substrate-binding protein [Cupriavidus sp. CV2]|uniref:ABC transporter substrate-binding protein n=1 Tax=Cupriavidus ulmosensis TaxID=3065913 RepID=UPI00296AB7B9|nr:ABC transporter substrate-binding protein [Cupriavidus sp. CV2]MDW3682143.1 ABC transporter substrate-binding protein [Cupriavidus sp. CV2]